MLHFLPLFSDKLMSSVVESQRLNVRNVILRFLEECMNMREVKQIHTQVIKSPYIHQNDRPMIVSRLLYFCAISGSGSLSYADDVFCAIKNPNLYVYNIMIRAYATTQTSEIRQFRSLLLYKQMRREEIYPNNLTFPFLVKESTARVDLLSGASLHAQAIGFGLYHDAFVQNSLITFYSSCGSPNLARQMFNEILHRDVVSWNSMIIGYLRSGHLDEALELFRSTGYKNVVTWNSIITGFVQGDRPYEALELFHEMQAASFGVKPDKITIASALSACSRIGAMDQGKRVHNYLTRTGIQYDLVIGTALLDMYGKCGSVERAHEIFEEMAEKDNLAYTAMISVFALHGRCEQAFEVFRDMEINGVKPNHVTFVGLLSACSHMGLVERGRRCFESMKRVYLIEPQACHYASLVDILGRAGLFEEAKTVIREMPVKPDRFVWGALLGACRMHGNVKLGETLARYLIGLDPEEHAFYVNLWEIYTKTGRFEDAKRVRSVMKERGMRKETGVSSIEIDGVVREFSVVRGSPCVGMERVFRVLSVLNQDMNSKETLACDASFDIKR